MLIGPFIIDIKLGLTLLHAFSKHRKMASKTFWNRFLKQTNSPFSKRGILSGHSAQLSSLPLTRTLSVPLSVECGLEGKEDGRYTLVSPELRPLENCEVEILTENRSLQPIIKQPYSYFRLGRSNTGIGRRDCLHLLTLTLLGKEWEMQQGTLLTLISTFMENNRF